MAPEHRDWTRHGAGRCLLWWPLCSFVLIAVFPDAGILPIVVSGAALAALGSAVALATKVARRTAPVREASSSREDPMTPFTPLSGARSDVR